MVHRVTAKGNSKIMELIVKIVSLFKGEGRKIEENSPNRIKRTKLRNSYLNELARRYGGKLLLRSEIALHDSTFQKLLAYHYFTAVPSIQKSLFTTRCVRCNNEKSFLLANIRCERCNKTHLYCRSCIQMGRVMECEKLYYWSGISYDWPKQIDPSTWTGQLTSAQQFAARSIVNAVNNGGELLVWAVAGAGKTEMLFPGISLALEKGKRICIATPRADVVRELLPRLKRVFSTIHIQGLYSGSRDNDGTSQLMIATTHQLLRYQHAFDLLIIDEIDAFPFHNDKSLQFAADRAAKKNATRIYLTATPRKTLQKQIMNKKIKYVFVPRRFHGYPLPEPKNVYSSKVKQTLLANTLPIEFIKWLKTREKQERQLLIFVPTIQLAETIRFPLIKLLLQEKQITNPKEIISVHAEDRHREKKIHLFRNRKIYALITTTILERGVTFPAIDVAVLDAGHDVFDEAALVQIAGRAGRSPIDPTGEVIFFHDGKTDAIVLAKEAIVKMNKRSKKDRSK